MIFKDQRPYAIGEKLLNPVIEILNNISGGNNKKGKMTTIPLSTTTVESDTKLLYSNILQNTIKQIKSSTLGLSSIQLDETTNCEANPQLIMVVRWFDSEGAKQNILALEHLGASTRVNDIFLN